MKMCTNSSRLDIEMGTKVKRKVDPPGNEDATEVSVRHDHHVSSIRAFFLVLSMMLANLTAAE